jgi:hypothetical protein
MVVERNPRATERQTFQWWLIRYRVNSSKARIALGYTPLIMHLVALMEVGDTVPHNSSIIHDDLNILSNLTITLGKCG